MKLLISNIEKRAAAFGIDTFMAVGCILIMIPFDFIGWVLQTIIAVVLYLFWYLFFPLIWNGQTFGKKFQKIKVVKMDGTDASKGLVIAREIIKLSLNVITVYVFAVISLLITILRKNGTFALHDIICKTKVVDLEATQKYMDHKDEEFSENKGFDAKNDLFDAIKEDVPTEEK